MKKMRLFPKTFLYTMGIMSILIIIAHALLYFLMPSVYVQQKNANANALVEKLAEEMREKTLEEILEIATTSNEEENASISIRTASQTFSYISSSVLDSTQTEYITFHDMVSLESIPSSTALVPEIKQGNSKDEVGSYLISAPAQIDAAKHTFPSTITYEREILLKDQSKASIIVTSNLQPVNEASAVMFQILPYTITISILISLCAAYLYARALTKPIKAICASTKQMETLAQECTCMVSSQDEIGELAGSINQLYSTLQTTISSLEDEIKQASMMEQTKVDFLRSASHELKTPLTSLRVILENMMLDIGKYKDHPTYLEKCHAITLQLSEMVQEILDASSLEAAHQKNKKEAIELREWIQKECEPYLLIAKSKGIQMKLSLQENKTIHQSPSLLHKAISNILSNAVQYTEAGQTIHIYFHKQQLFIENECIPIKEAHLAHLKEAFYRPDFSRSKQTGGNGLGLYIVDQILAMLQLPYSFVPYEHGMRFIIDLTDA